MQLDLMGIKINTESKAQILQILEGRFKSGKKTFIATPYSEFFYYVAQNYKFRRALSQTNISIPDGVSVLWLARYLSIPLTVKNYFLKIIQAFWQLIYTDFEILLQPRKIRSVIQEKITGVDFFWELARFAQKNNLKIFLLGGFGNTPEIVAKKITDKFPGAKIAGTSNAGPEQASVREINAAGADILAVAYGPVRQELWIAENFEQLNAKIVIGLGGTFDYAAGIKKFAPNFMRRAGLEWLYRLITQPYRYKRIWTATFLFLRGALRYKVLSSMPFRQNVVGVIINAEHKILVGQRVNSRDMTSSGDETNFVRAGELEEHWQLPQGGVYPKEDQHQALCREMNEELGITKLKILGSAKETYTYLWQQARRPLWFNRLKFKGQEQTIYFLKYDGDESEIKLEPDEFSAYKWVNKEQLRDTIHPVRREMLEVVLKEIDKYI